MNIQKKMISLFVTVVVIFSNIIPFGIPVNAAEDDFVSSKYNRIIFVVDCSNSMNYQDANKLTNEVVKMFVDASHSTKTDIGLITYNDQILSTTNLTPMDSQENRNIIKNSIDNSIRRGSTDIGLALNTAMDTFVKNPKENSKQAVVLISDGETDLTYTTTGRTMEDSKKDEAEAMAKSKDLNCPIYTIGLSKEGSLNTEYLKEISDNTMGKTYEMQNQSQLQPLFNNLFTDVTDIPVLQNEIVVGTGSEQSIEVAIPKDYVYESNVIIGHSQPINGVNTELKGGSTKAEINSEKYYTSAKLTNPDSDNIDLKLTAAKGDEIKINTINFVSVIPIVETPKSLASKDVTITSRLYSEVTKKAIADKNLYKDLTAELNLTNPETGEVETIPMTNSGADFTATYDNTKPQTVDMKVNIRGKGYNINSPVKNMVFSNSKPEQTITEKVNVLKSDKTKEMDLNKLFKDIDGGNLSYKLIENKLPTVKAEIKDDTLLITPNIEETGSLTISTSDDRGETMTANVIFDIMPFWSFYRNEILIIGCIFIALLLLYLIFARKTKKQVVEEPTAISSTGQRFNGVRFEGYFLNTLSGNDVPALFWNGNMIENKHSVSLGDLFSILDVSEKLHETYKVYFEAGNNGAVIFRHDTRCIVSLGNRDVPPGKQVVLHIDDKLYIVFEDNVTEIEIRYKRVRKMARV